MWVPKPPVAGPAGQPTTAAEGQMVSRKGALMFAAMGVIWGIPYLLIKVAVGGVPVPVLVESRVTIGAALLLPIALRRRQLAVLRPYWPWLVLFAVTEMIVPWLLLSDAERTLTSSLAGLLIASVPIIAAVLTVLAGGDDRLSLIRWTGLLAGLAGVGLLAGRSAAGGDARSVVEVLLVALGYATGPLIASRKLSDAPPIGMTTACLAIAAVVYAPVAALTWPDAVPDAKVLAAIGTLAVVCTAVAFLVFFALITEVGPARATVITYINPAVAVALGVGVLGERLTLTMLGAFVLILGGSVLATRPARREPQPEAPEPAEINPAAAAPPRH
jgi:drug/metabolite transporter (DMT)-like permease